MNFNMFFNTVFSLTKVLHNVTREFPFKKYRFSLGVYYKYVHVIVKHKEGCYVESSASFI
jgi:hypothetical protein